MPPPGKATVHRLAVFGVLCLGRKARLPADYGQHAFRPADKDTVCGLPTLTETAPDPTERDHVTVMLQELPAATLTTGVSSRYLGTSSTSMPVPLSAFPFKAAFCEPSVNRAKPGRCRSIWTTGLLRFAVVALGTTGAGLTRGTAAASTRL